MKSEATMRNRKRIGIALFVVSLFLLGIQAGIWAKSTAHARSETDKQNIEEHRPPSEIAGIAGFTVLIIAGVIASIPSRNVIGRRRSE